MQNPLLKTKELSDSVKSKCIHWFIAGFPTSELQECYALILMRGVSLEKSGLGSKNRKLAVFEISDSLCHTVYLFIKMCLFCYIYHIVKFKMFAIEWFRGNILMSLTYRN